MNTKKGVAKPPSCDMYCFVVLNFAFDRLEMPLMGSQPGKVRGNRAIERWGNIQAHQLKKKARMATASPMRKHMSQHAP